MLTRRILRCSMSVAAVLAGLAGMIAAAPAAFSQADEDCYEIRQVITGVDENGNPTFGPKSVNICEDEGEGGSSGGGSNTCVHSALGEIPCVDPAMGWWSSAEDCYVSLLSPQPPAGDGRWDGNDPADGAVYQFYCYVGGPGGWSVQTEFRAEAPGQPSIVELVQEAIQRLPLTGAQIGIAPDPSGTGLVGLPVWMWTESTEATWGPITRSASIPGITVTARAQATQIEWDMGDGTTVVCDGPGKPYLPEYGDELPECGHVYEVPSRDQPDGRFQITATTTWDVEWWVEGGGAEGGDGFFRESSTSVQINELQVVTS